MGIDLNVIHDKRRVYCTMNLRSSRGEYRLTASDGWRIIIILVLYGILSFFHLGNMEAPQTTWYWGDHTTSMVLDLGSEQKVAYLRQLTGARFGTFQIAISNDNVNYSEVGTLEQDKVFAWQDMELNVSGRYIRITSGEKEGSISEIAFYGPNNQKLSVVGTDEASNILVDEQDMVPEKISYMNTTYFDEIYHARTAYEYVNEMQIYEWTHPPLGKLIMSIPIQLFGMTPFNYRVMGNIAGLLMLIVMYIFAKRMFKSTKYATIAMILFAADGMHFVQTRIGTVDSYLVLFIMLAYLFMYQYISCDANKEVGKMHFNLLASGIFMGCAIATKWNGAYCAVGLAIIFFINLFSRNSKASLMGKWHEYRGKIIIGCFGYFIIVPILIYILSYIPDMRINPEVGTLKGFIQLQIRMFKYHSELEATHPFSSPWYLWPLGIKPLWYYDGSAGNIVSSITLHSNPFIWWTGILAMLYSVYQMIVNRSKNAIFIVIAILSAYVPYMGVPRIMFIYHYFPIVPIMILAIVMLLKDIEDDSNLKVAIGYTVIAVVVFAFFYPIYSGLEIPRWYAETMNWFEAWKLF